MQLSDSSGTAGRQEIFSLLFLGKALRRVDQLMQTHAVYADDFSAEDVVQKVTGICWKEEMGFGDMNEDKLLMLVRQQK